MHRDAFYLSADDPPSKRAILTAALDLFARDGIDGTNVRAIAARAGYTNPALFKFFDGKETLALYLFERCYRECLLAMRAAVHEQTSYALRMSAALRGFAAFIDANPEAFFFVHDNVREFWPKLSAAARKQSVIGEFRKLLRQGRREGAIDRRAPLEIQLAAVTGFLFQIARLRHFGDLERGVANHTADIEAMVGRMLA